MNKHYFVFRQFKSLLVCFMLTPFFSWNSAQAQAFLKFNLQVADLSISNLQVPAEGLQGTLVDFTFDLHNDGNAAVNGDYRVVAYLSLDEVWDTTDVEVGYVQTGNTPVGTIPGIAGQFLLHDDIPGPGSYKLFLVADAENTIEEVNEDNNSLFVPFEVLAVQNEGECGFLESYGALPDLNTEELPSIIEHPYGYTWQYTALNGALLQLVEMELDFEGELLNLTSISEPYMPEVPDRAVLLEVVNQSQLQLQRINFGNELQWTTTIGLNAPSTVIMLQTGFAANLSDGFLIAGSYMDDTFAFSAFFLKLDLDGNLLEETFLESQPYLPQLSLGFQDALENNYIQMQLNDELYMVKIDGNANNNWIASLENNLALAELRAIRWKPLNGNFFAAFYKDEKAYIRKFDIATGELLFDKELGSVFSPNGLASSKEQIRDFIATDDGGVVAGYSYIVPGTADFGYEYGKLDANGSLEWWYELAQYYDMDARLAVSDGGYLFTGTRNDDTIAVMKTTSTGEIFPTCIDTSIVIDLELSVTPVQFLANQNAIALELQNNGSGTASGIVVSVPKPLGLEYDTPTAYTSTQGLFDFGESDDWIVDELPAGASATLTIYYTFNSPFAQTIFAEVAAAHERDIDSQPGNGNAPLPQEDDEAAIELEEEGSDVIITLSHDGALHGEAQIMDLYPNPVAEQVTVELVNPSREQEEALVQCFNTLGKLVQQHRQVLDRGRTVLQWNVEALPAGTYILRLNGNSRRFIKH